MNNNLFYINRVIIITLIIFNIKNVLKVLHYYFKINNLLESLFIREKLLIYQYFYN